MPSIAYTPVGAKVLVIDYSGSLDPVEVIGELGQPKTGILNEEGVDVLGKWGQRVKVSPVT